MSDNRTVDDLVMWLRAQLDEDERVAQRVRSETEGTWAWTYRNVHAVKTDGTTEPIASTDTGAQAVYFGLWNPDRVLAEVDAKQRIVDSFAASTEPLTARTAEKAVARMVLKLLALPYADRPGYRDEWRP